MGNEKLANIQDLETEIKQLESKLQKEVEEVQDEHKRNALKEDNLEKKVALLKNVRAVRVASTAELQQLVNEEKRLHQDNVKAKAVPKKESLRKVMDTVRYMGRNKLKTATELGDHIE